MTALPVNVDAAYADETLDPSVKIHQQHHDFLHGFYNFFEQAIEDGGWPDGGIPFYVLGDGQFSIIDPAIAGSPGPQGETGVGFLHRGVWSGSTGYNAVTVNDQYEVVSYGRHAYYALTTHTNSQPQVNATTGAPEASTQWGVFASGGLDGTDGEDGADGGPGPIGPIGPAGPARDVYEDLGNVSGTVAIDAADATLYKLTLVGDATITFSDTSGAAGSGVTLRVFQGAGAPHDVSWANVLHWFTDDELAPDLGSTAGDVKVVIADAMADEWYGYSPGVAGTPPAEIYPTLDMEAIAGGTGADGVNRIGAGATLTYTLGSAIQIGAKRGGLCAVELVRDDSIDPPMPTLVGAGATWVQVGTTLHGAPTSTTRRRLTVFACRDATAGAASQLTVGVLAAVGDSYTGVCAHAVRTAGNVADTWVAALQNNFGVRHQGDSGELSSAAHATMLPPADAANRAIAVFAVNATLTTMTPEAGFAVIGAESVMSGPTIQVRWIWNDSTFDQTPSVAIVPNSQWAMWCGELEQA